MGKVYSFCNQKGGVGKTTTAINVGTVLGKLGAKVLIVDMDPQGNATSGLGIDKNEKRENIYSCLVQENGLSQAVIRSAFTNVDVVTSNGDLAGAEIELINVYGREFIFRSKIDEVRGKYDFIFVDCPPSLGLLTINALVGSDIVIIPLQCEYYALEGLGQLLKTYNLVKEKLNHGLEIGGVILTMADFRTNLAQQVIEEVRTHFGEKVFRTVIPRSVKISEAPSFGKPITEYDPSSKGSLAYEALGREFYERFRDEIKVEAEEREVSGGDKSDSIGEAGESVQPEQAQG